MRLFKFFTSLECSAHGNLMYLTLREYYLNNPRRIELLKKIVFKIILFYFVCVARLCYLLYGEIARFFVWRGCVIFGVEKLWDFLCGEIA